MKKWSIEEITKRLDNLKKIYNRFFVDQAICYGRFMTSNEVDALHYAFYWLKDRKLKYRRNTFGTPRDLSCRITADYTIFYNDYCNMFVTSSSYTTTTISNSIW